MNCPPGPIGLRQHPERLESLWLASWDARRQHLDFATAQRLDNESFRKRLDRQIVQELDLVREKNYLISSQAQRHLDQPVEPTDDKESQTVDLNTTVLDRRASRTIVDLNKAAC